MTNVDISFITINYNSSDMTVKLVESIIKNTSSKICYEIIVVDNASNLQDFKYLKNYFIDSRVKIVRNKINSGFASGNMLGVNYVTGKYYFFINNDCLFLNDVSTTLLEHCSNYDDVALATSLVVDDNNNSSSTHKLFPSLIKEYFGNTIARRIKKTPSNKSILETPTDVEVISGSCMFFRADIFCAIGGFDTGFFLYCEEEDICKRVIDYGYKIQVVPQAKVYHKAGGSTKKCFEIKREYYISYFLLLSKHFFFVSKALLVFSLYLKLFRRSFRGKEDFKLFLFSLKGFSTNYSLRYKQKLLSE